jgi:LCP family protein required for cell wall assembly
MPDRPRNGGPEDGPDYQWLYGGRGEPPEEPQATRPVPRQPREPGPDETRVIRAQPRPDERRTSARPTPPPVAPPVQPAGSDGGRPRRRFPFRFRFRLRYVFVLLVLWLVFLVAVPILAWNKVDKVDFDPGGDRPADQAGTTYLLVGSDSREGLSKEERKELNTGNAGGGRTDTIMLLHTGSGPNTLLSIPRDLEVEIPEHGTSKVNAAYALGGAKLLVQTIEGLTGIRVDQYVEIGMGGVVGIVDSVGGIEICPQKGMVDKDAGLNIKKGCQDVDGQVALAYSRSRHAQQLGDLDRVRHQREVVAAIGDKVLSPWTVVNPVRWWRLNNSLPDFFKFGEGMGPTRALMWASAMASVGGKGGLTCTVPLTSGSASALDEELADQLFERIREDKTDDITAQLCLSSGLVDVP